MDRPPDPNSNGQSNGNGKSYTNGNGKGIYPAVEVRRTAALRPYPQRRSSLLPLLGLCLLVGLGTVLLFQTFRSASGPEAQPSSDTFRWGVNRAMSAAELTQTARSSREWQQIVTWWQEAIEFMDSVPVSNQNYAIARNRVDEYRKNLQYAERRAKTATGSDSLTNLWGIGSRRAAVLKVEGTPADTDRYDATCKEILRYGKSNVELSNGIVVGYEDFDRRLQAAAPGTPPAAVYHRSHWGLDSPKESVFKVQGTPTRVVDYDHSDRETLYYGSSTVDLFRQQVIGYDNNDKNLKVRVEPIATDPQGGNLWTLSSSREEIFRVQGTPTAVLLEPSACSETLYYGNSMVVLKNGFIAGYDNLDNNLRVKAR
jgi:hypothetical protein